MAEGVNKGTMKGNYIKLEDTVIWSNATNRWFLTKPEKRREHFNKTVRLEARLQSAESECSKRRVGVGGANVHAYVMYISNLRGLTEKETRGRSMVE